MKKWMKVILISGGVLVAAGTVMITAAAVSGGENCRMGFPGYERMHRYEQMHGDREYVPVEGNQVTADSRAESPAKGSSQADFPDPGQLASGQAADQAFTNVAELDLKNCAGAARITESDELEEGEILVRQLGEGQDYRIWQEGRELSIAVPERLKKNGPNWGLNGEIAMKDVEIFVPAGFQFQELSIETVSGSFTADVIYARELSMEAVSGSIEILGGAVNYLDAENVSGFISCMAAADTEASAENISGDTFLYMAGDIGNYDYEVERAGGEIVLTGSTVVDYSKQMGNTRIDNRTGQSIDLECVGGSIMVQYEAASPDAL